MSRRRTPLVLFVFGSASAAAFACSSSPSSSSATDAVAVPPVPASPAPQAETEGRDAGAEDAAVVPRADAAPDAAPDAHDASLPPTVPGTGGKGGLPCIRVDDLGSGRQSCVAKVGSVELKIVQGKSSAVTNGVPFRLGLYLHGDGAVSHIDNTVLEAMLPWADAVHGLVVSALAPNGCAWWLAPSYDCSGSESPFDGASENAAALAGAVDAIGQAYDVRTDGMRYYSASGGSIFLTYEWIPMQGGNHPGVFAIMCGGVVSGVPYAWDTKDAALRARIPTWFTYGSEDGLRPQIEATTAAYLGMGFPVTTKVIPNQGHCTFDAHAEAMGIWSAHP